MGRKHSGLILPNGSFVGNRIGRQEDSSIANTCGNGNTQRVYRLLDPPSSAISGTLISEAGLSSLEWKSLKESLIASAAAKSLFFSGIWIWLAITLATSLIAWATVSLWDSLASRSPIAFKDTASVRINVNNEGVSFKRGMAGQDVIGRKFANLHLEL
jgi:hypothetical protein